VKIYCSILRFLSSLTVLSQNICALLFLLNAWVEGDYSGVVPEWGQAERVASNGHDFHYWLPVVVFIFSNRIEYTILGETPCTPPALLSDIFFTIKTIMFIPAYALVLLS
jgi:hypothetical protein